MGKINLSSLKSCIESANESYQQIESEKPAELQVVELKKADSMDELLQNADEMLRNIPSLPKTG
ncbi:MAG: hypothetical protein EA390_14055 [Balneolaceae bacterium]|nr:MAG: hypothetical protein EA390_14055 [Balneolaceae bacterium]